MGSCGRRKDDADRALGVWSQSADAVGGFLEIVEVCTRDRDSRYKERVLPRIVHSHTLTLTCRSHVLIAKRQSAS